MDTAAAEKLLTGAARAPRVSLADVEAAIREGEVSYTVLPNGRTTVCQIDLFGGRFSVEGQSACVSKENFDQTMGETFAMKEAVNEVWKALGTVLAWRLAKIDAAGEPEGRILSLGSDVKTYVGTKVVRATPMNRLAYNQLRDWALPTNENGNDQGYLVEYVDGGTPNLDGFAGYISWSPKEVFERSYSVGVESKQSTWLDRVKIEADELEVKWKKLTLFIQTPEFENLRSLEKQDLKMQASAMEDYLWVLRRRIRRAAAQNKH